MFESAPEREVGEDPVAVEAVVEEADTPMNGYGGHEDITTAAAKEERCVLVPRMPSSGTLFGRLPERNVTFCIDTSGSMIDCLESLKEHVIGALEKKALEEGESTFNLIEFSSQVTQWSDQTVKCTPQTVAVAAQWVKALQPSTGTNTLEALLTAFSDGGCEAVCLVTDGLPDQEASDILDHVVYASQNRPVHTYYIQGGSPDSAATEFLQDLAMETYGSFHIVTISQEGEIERITPIYRAEATAERIIRTSQGNIYPSNHKVCSVTSRLGAPPPSVPLGPSTIVVQEPSPYTLHPYHLYPWPYRYYYHHYSHPEAHAESWSRYRTAKSLLAHQQEFYDNMIHVCPGAGSLVVGTKVLARRHDDGLFYRGTVKSQLMSNKFLVELGPCRHGKYRDTTYQETYIYDIVSYDDALRHAVLSGDRVLAPWLPDGEKYGPGVVIEGQERRIAKGGIEDQSLVVTFYNGKTAKISLDTALWIPSQLYERIVFEVQLPSHVRREFAEQEEYPEENQPGYPTSEVQAFPEEYQTYDSRWVPNNRNVVVERGMYKHPYYVPLYPVYYKYKPKPSALRSADISQIIPGTEMTKAELNEKVMSQLMKHKLDLNGETRESTRKAEDTKLLRKREVVREANTLKKSVTFERSDSDLEGEFDAGDLEMRDSGRGSADDLYLSDMEGEMEERSTQTSKMGPEGQIFYRRRTKKTSDKRPPWRYWNNEPAPELMEPMHYGAYRVGPYDECYVQPPMECRDTMLNSRGAEWTSSLSKVVDPYASYKYPAGVRDSMHVPQPPKYKPDKQGPGQDLWQVLGTPLPNKEKLAMGRAQYRHQRALQRELTTMENAEDRERMRVSMVDQNRDRSQAQLDFERARHAQEWQALQNAREAKQRISENIRGRVEEKQAEERAQEGQRLVSRVVNRERREHLGALRQQEIQETIARRQVIKEQNAQNRWDSIQANMAEKEAQDAAMAQQRRTASAQRRQHYRNLEAEGQKRKEIQTHTREVNTGLIRSQIFP